MNEKNKKIIEWHSILGSRVLNNMGFSAHHWETESYNTAEIVLTE